MYYRLKNNNKPTDFYRPTLFWNTFEKFEWLKRPHKKKHTTTKKVNTSFKLPICVVSFQQHNIFFLFQSKTIQSNQQNNEIIHSYWAHASTKKLPLLNLMYRKPLFPVSVPFYFSIQYQIKQVAIQTANFSLSPWPAFSNLYFKEGPISYVNKYTPAQHIYSEFYPWYM